jgi:hypothetical protein
MIKKDTILSVYTDKQTLLEYLTAIEKALDNAVLVSADIVDEGSNKCHFVFTFEDDTKIITPTIEFIKPVKGATIRNGVLFLTLADGTEVSAGSITASFGASTFNGDVLVKGSETSTENISAGGFIQTDNYVRPLTEADRLNYSFTQAETAIGEEVTAGAGTYSILYGLARTSNGKLNIVVVGKVTITDALTISSRSRILTVNIPISANVGSRIFPIPGAQYNMVDSKQGDLFRLGAYVPAIADDFTKKIYFSIGKNASGLTCVIALGSGTIPVGSYAFRFEENISL